MRCVAKTQSLTASMSSVATAARWRRTTSLSSSSNRRSTWSASARESIGKGEEYATAVDMIGREGKGALFTGNPDAVLRWN